MILPIDKSMIPYQFEAEFNGFVFTFEIHYNAEQDFFTVDLYKNDDIVIYGEKLVYGQQLFISLNDETLPRLIPLDPSDKNNEITYGNFTETVFLQVMDDAV